MIRLLDAAPGELRSLLPPGRDLAAWHGALAEEIARHLSPAHALFLARPEHADGGTAWIADGATRNRYADLPAEGRRAVDLATGAILSDIRRLAESGAAPVVREAWPALREIPDMGHLFAVDGRPVLAAWGHAGESGASGRLARLDDGVPWRAAPRTAWGRYGAALGVLAALALAAGLLLPWAGPWLVDPPAACAVVPGQLDAMRGQMELESRGQALRTLLATLTEETGRRQLQCPIPAAPPPTRPPAPRAALPQSQWGQRDVSLLKGCWSLATEMSIRRDGQGAGVPLRSWRMCFDEHGAGRQTETLEDGRSCDGPLAATFEGDRLHVTESPRCTGPDLRMGHNELLCRRVSDAEAQCEGRNPNGTTFEATFKR